MPERFESFVIDKVDPESGHMQGHSKSGKIREFALVVNRDLATNKLQLGVARHFSDGVPHWDDSSPWDSYETQGDRE